MRILETTVNEPISSSIESEKSLNLLRNQLTIVVPTLNEEEAIGPLIDDIKAHGYDKILVVDGYSKDQTKKIAEDRGARVVGQHGKGKSGAILVARDILDTPYFLLMDGDYTYDPGDIDRFLMYTDSYDERSALGRKNSNDNAYEC